MKIFNINIPNWMIEFAYTYFIKSNKPSVYSQLSKINVNTDLSQKRPILSIKTPDLGSVVLEFNEGLRNSEGHISIKPVKKLYCANGRSYPLYFRGRN
jgi:hypothetical protein